MRSDRKLETHFTLPSAAAWSRWLIAPVPTLDEQTAREAQTLSSIVLFILALSILHLLLVDSPLIDSGVPLLPPVGLLVIYAMSRTGYHKAACWLLVTLSGAYVFLLSLPVNGMQTQALLFLIVPLLIVSIFFSMSVVTLLAAGYMAAILALVVFVNGLTWDDSIIEAEVLLGAIGGVLLLSSLYRRVSRLQSVRLFTMMEFSPNLVAVHKEDRFLYINPAGIALLKADSAQQILEAHLPDFWLKQDEDNTPTKMIRTGQREEFALLTQEKFKCLDGTLLDLEITSMPTIYDNQLATQIVARDVTDLKRIQADLHETQVRDQTIDELMSDYAYQLNLDAGSRWKPAWFKGAFTEITGYTFDEIGTWLDITRLAHLEDISVLTQHLTTVSEGSTHVSEYRIITRAGETRWVRDYARPLMDAQTGDVAGIAGVIQDVTIRLEAEQALKNHALQQAVVAELGQHALSQANMTAMFEEAVTLVAQVLDVEFCLVLELAPDKSMFLDRARVGWWNDESFTLNTETTQAGLTVLLEEPVVIEDIATDVRFKETEFLHRAGIQSGISVVIHGVHQPYGVLEAHSLSKRKFNLDDVNFMQAVANVLSAFIQRKNTENAEREQRLLAEALRDIAATLNSTLEFDEVLDRVLIHLSRVLPHDAASIFLLEGSNVRVIRYMGFGQYGHQESSIRNAVFPISESSVIQRMLKTYEPVVIADCHNYEGWVIVEGGEWIQSYVGAPVILEGKMIGLINVDSATRNAFSDKDALRLMAFANQASIAIRNARHATELERIVAERTDELHTERNRLQTILDATGEGIFYTQEMTILYANEAFYRMTGFEPADLEGKETTVLINEPDLSTDEANIWQETRALLMQGQIVRGERKLSRKDGRSFDAGLTISMAGITDEKITTVTVVRDISQAKQLDVQKSRFIANASHELRTPIASMNTRLYLLRRDRANFDQHLDLLERVVGRMSSLVEDLLDVSRFENGVITLRKRDVVLQNLITDVVEVLRVEAAEKHIDLSYHLPEYPIHVFVDPERILQVITNLISNAIHYTFESGSITVSLDTQYNEQRKSEDVVISIQDKGTGIAPENQEHIFQPFYRAEDRVQGTGLGLSIAREIVRLHNGEIMLESHLGEGSIFYVHLPLA